MVKHLWWCIHIIYNAVARAFYAWAMREIRPDHPDVPKIMQRQAQLREAWQSLTQRKQRK